MAPGRTRGARAADIQLALAGIKPIDDNDFNLQMQTLVENSVNIHDDPNAKTYWFEQEVNPRARVRVNAKNDNLWKPTATASSLSFPGKDTEWLQREIRRCFVSESQSPSQIVVLGPNWQEDNWTDDLPEQERPNLWARQVLLVVPDVFSSSAALNALSAQASAPQPARPRTAESPAARTAAVAGFVRSKNRGGVTLW